MPYRYLDDVATADIAFEAWGKTLDEMFVAAAEATINVMVEILDTIESVEQKTISVREQTIDLLLLQFLQELIFFKDAESLLLRVRGIHVKKEGDHFFCLADAGGEKINAGKHALKVDVKAVTFHRFQVRETSRGWEATVVLDI